MEELQRVLQLDLERTFPEKDFFKNDNVQELMLNVLTVFFARSIADLSVQIVDVDSGVFQLFSLTFRRNI